MWHSNGSSKKKCSASPMAPTKPREKSQPPLVWLPFRGSWEWPNQEDGGALTKSCKIVVSIALITLTWLQRQMGTIIMYLLHLCRKWKYLKNSSRKSLFKVKQTKSIKNSCVHYCLHLVLYIYDCSITLKFHFQIIKSWSSCNGTLSYIFQTQASKWSLFHSFKHMKQERMVFLAY